MSAIAGIYTIIITHTNVIMSIGNNAAFLILNMYTMLCIRERLMRINETFPITSATKEVVLAMIFDCPHLIIIRCTANTTARTNNHCSTLRSNVFFPKSDSFGLRGLRDIMFSSAFSHSKIIEHAGSIINSMNTTWIGYRIIGRQRKIGNTIIPAYGI